MKAAGFCPMGCGQTLAFREEDGAINCAAQGCPEPEAVGKILGDEETEHVVTFDVQGFSIQHPLRERIGGALHECALHRVLADHSGPPYKPGRYRATLPIHIGPRDERSLSLRVHWDFERLDA